jgi:transcriptional regulator with XRE-family HTH domain
VTPAELRTAHDALGVSTEFLAERLGISSQQVWRYENPKRTADIPERVAEVVRDLLNDQECAVERITSELAASDDPIPRYVSMDDFDMAVPELRGWGPNAQGLLIVEVQRRLERSPYASSSSVEYIQPQ